MKRGATYVWNCWGQQAAFSSSHERTKFALFLTFSSGVKDLYKSQAFVWLKILLFVFQKVRNMNASDDIQTPKGYKRVSNIKR